jgi:hypothetical protein
MLASPLFGQPKTFAAIEANGYRFVADTAMFKSDILRIVFAQSPRKPVFDRVRIVNAKTFGERAESYYMVLLTDSKRGIKVARWLERKAGDLLLINDFDGGNYWQVLYMTCIGETDCYPQVGTLGNEKLWSCLPEFACRADSGCEGSKTMTVDD